MGNYMIIICSNSQTPSAEPISRCLGGYYLFVKGNVGATPA